MAKTLEFVIKLNGQGNLTAFVKEADASLNRLAGTGKQAGDGINAGFSAARAGVQSISTQLQRLKTEFIGLVSVTAAFQAVKTFVNTADAISNMNARLKLATKSAEEFAAAKQGVVAVALKTGQSLESVGGLYAKVADSMRQMGKSQQETLVFTEAVAQSMKLSGSSASAAEAGITQLAQALGSGVLRGDEFNSIMENSPRLAQAMADGLDVPKGALRSLAEEGKLTADIVTKAILSQKDALSGEFAKIPLTVAQSFQNLGTAMSLWVEKVDASNGVTAKLSSALAWLAQNFDLVASTASALATTLLGGLALRAIPALIAGFISAKAAFAALLIEMRTLQGASLSGAIAQIGALKSASMGLFSAWAGWEIGTWAQENFETVRLAGVAMASGIHQALAFVSGASKQEMQAIRDGYYDGFQAATDSARQASAAAVAAKEAALAKTKAQLEQEKTAYAALNETIKAQYTERLAALDALLQQQTALIAATATNETAKEAATTAAIMAAHVERLALIKSYQTEALALIEQEKTARLAAVKASGETEKQINGEAMTAKRDLLAGLLGEYQNHFNSLNAQYSAHLAHVNQIEAAKRAAVMGAEEAIREMARSTMTARQAYADQQKQIDELQAKAKKALEEGNFKQAQEYSEKAIGLAKTTANEVKQGDQVIIDKRQAVATATNQVKESLELMKAAYDGQGAAAKGEAAQTLQAMNDTKSATENLRTAVQLLDTALSAQHALTVKTNIPEVRAQIKSLDGQNTSSTHTIYVTKVEKNAIGGLVGSGVNRYASGGLVQRFANGGGVFKKPGWNKVPGSGNGDTVPAALQAGSYVLKKSASQYYGDGLLGRIANGVQQFAWGGLAKWGGGASVAEDPLSALRARVADLISKYSLVAKGKVFLNAVSNDLALAKDEESLKNLGKRVAAALFNGSIYESTVLAGTNRRKSAELGALANWAYAQKFASGGHAAGSDTVPAMLTPGEWVVKKSAVDKYGLGLLDDLNNMRIPKAALSGGHAPRIARFAEGGKVGGMSAMASSSAKTSQASGISLTVNAPTGNADDIVRALAPALNRLATKSR